MDKEFDYCRNDECECCWDFDNTHYLGIYREDYEMVICDDCWKRSEEIEKRNIDKSKATMQ